MNDIYIVYAEGFVFIGEQVGDCLKKCIRVDTVNTMTQQGPMPLTVLRPLEADLSLDISKYPHHVVSSSHPLYRDYVKEATGIDVVSNRLPH